MEGYSVTEAASILGVPIERVWELLARGVLAGMPEGEAGMRVFLQPRPAPAPVSADPVRPDGDGGSGEPQRELSPFRELLTEFRNLTERYGQALLALGESRGEVASLRSRVDLLEARMDLRLPVSIGPIAAGPTIAPPTWPAPDVAPVETATVEAVHEPPASESDATTPQAEAERATREDMHAEGEDEERRRRRRGHRRATESFAEALARAEDPTKPELPGAAETAAALAALREDAVHEGEHAAEAVLPRELPAAEHDADARRATGAGGKDRGDDYGGHRGTGRAGRILPPSRMLADEPPVREAHAEPEPPEEVAVAPQPEEPISDEVIEEVTAGAALEPVREDAEMPATASVVDSGETEDGAAAVEPEPPAEPEPAAEAEPAAESEPAVEPEPPAEAEPAAELEPIAWDPERYTVEIVEPDWYADEEADAFAAAPEVGVEDRTAAAVETAAIEEPAEAEEPAEPEEPAEAKEPAADVSREPVEEVAPEPDVTDRPEVFRAGRS